MRRERLSRDDLDRIGVNRPPRRVHRDPPDLPVHYGGWVGPAPCGLSAGSWAARTNVPDYVTCTGCRQPRPAVVDAARQFALAAHQAP